MDMLAKGDSKLKLILVTTSKGSYFKDPIYIKLKEMSGIITLLHERPLYLIGRSLLDENQKLFKLAEKLYSTRNKIVHLSELPVKTQDFLPISKIGAENAIQIANEIFKWELLDLKN